MRRNQVLVFLIILTFSFFSEERNTLRATELDSSRVALVIGNSMYEHITELENAEKDAKEVAKALENLGFKVSFVANATKKGFRDKITEWGDNLKDGAVALFYYVGHGMQINGDNYLIPVDAYIRRENEIEFDSVDANRVLAKIEDAGCSFNIVILDACRKGPSNFDFLHRGFAEIKAPPNTLIVYSTRSGEPATDINSFSHFFYSRLKEESHLEINDFIRRVSDYVFQSTGGKQLPLRIGDLNNFYFNEKYIKVPGPQGPIEEKGKVMLASKSGKLEKISVIIMIERRGFFERSWHPIKNFKNHFEEIKKKKITLIKDNTTDLMWHQKGSKAMTYEEAEAWIDKLKENQYAGFADWRFPSIEEAASLLKEMSDHKNGDLYIDCRFSSKQKRIWTWSIASGDDFKDDFMTLYWTVDFKNGIVARFSKDSSISVRPVRSIRYK